MNITPEIKAQLDEQKKQCIFCKLISGEMEAKKVFEDDKTMAMLDIYPALKGHTLFMLKEHYPIMPYIPEDEFIHLFSLLPDLAKSLQSAFVKTGMNVFIANGWAAGQQSGHFLLHFLPRDPDDGFFNFYFKLKSKTSKEHSNIIQNNLSLMMNNHFARLPASWHQGFGKIPDFLSKTKNNSTMLYEDEKVLAVMPDKAAVPGHITIYSKTEDKDFTKLSQEDSAHLFYVTSYAASLIFEVLKAQGTNIILRSGSTDDNQEKLLCIDILPRTQEDSFKEMLWKPQQPSYDLDKVVEKIKDKTWKIKFKIVKTEKKIEHKETEEKTKHKETKEINLSSEHASKCGGSCGNKCENSCEDRCEDKYKDENKIIKSKKCCSDSEQEIMEAIRNIQQ